jgi:hypothetical protein
VRYLRRVQIGRGYSVSAMRHTAPLALLIVVFSVVLGGCGGSTPTLTKAEFQTAVSSARDRTDYALAQITQAKSKADFVNRMESSADLIDEAADDLSKKGAAEGFESDVDKLTESLRQLAADLRGTAEQVSIEGYEELLNARGVSFQSWVDINNTLASLGKRGITVQPLERH